MTHPGPPPAAFGTPEPAQGQPEAKKSGARKWASLAGTIAVVGVGAAYTLTGHFGIGDPTVGDCVHMKSETDFEVVECSSDQADAKVVGIENEKKTEAEFMADDNFCSAFEKADAGLWYQNGMITEKGTVYCVTTF